MRFLLMFVILLKKFWNWLSDIFWDIFWIEAKVPLPVLVLILLGLVALLVLYLSNGPNIDEKKFGQVLQGFSEYGFFEGQKDALKGDIRIEQRCSTWTWIKSPWDSAQPESKYCLDSVLYHPDKSELIMDGKVFKMKQ
jgi:hypothetical protein